MADRDSPTIGDYLIAALRRRGVEHIFGVPGDYILRLFQIGSEAGVTMVNSTREEAAVYAADGYAREKGLGAVAVTYGVGTLATLAATGGANAEQVPIAIIGGGPGLGERDGRHIHHMPTDDMDSPRRMISEVAARAVVIDDPDTAFETIDRTLDACVEQLRPVYIELPRDLIDARPDEVWRHHAARDAEPERDARLDAAVADLTDRLDAAERPVIWAGVGVLRRGLGERIMELAERIGAPVVESVMGKGAVSERNPLVLGVYSGATSVERVNDVVEGADVVLSVGLVENDINLGAFTADIPTARRVALDDTGLSIGYRDYRPLPFGAAFDALTAAPLRARPAPDALPHAWDTLHREDGRVTCDSLAATLNEFLEPEDILVSDVGVAAHLTMDVRLAAAGQLHIARYYVGMGFAVPASTGAVLARGTGRAIVLVGDGSFQMTGFDLSTAVRYGAKPIVLVLDNHGYGAERSIVDGPFNDVARWDYGAVGAVVGAQGTNVSTLAELTEALEEARSDGDRAWIIGVDLDAHDFPRALRRLGEGLEELMHRE